MENRGKILFEDDLFPQWYLAGGDQWMGPLTASDVYVKLLNHDVTWADYVWKTGESQWQRLCDLKVFHALIPKEPSKELQTKIKKLATPAIPFRDNKLSTPDTFGNKFDKKEWFISQKGVQYGPFSFQELSRLVQIEKVPKETYAWRDGMQNWDNIGNIKEFYEVVSAHKKNQNGKTTSKTKDQRVEQRRAPRRPLVARIFLTHEDSVIVAVCRDISIGGMQVLTDKVPGKSGTKIKMNISPAGDAKGHRIQPFIAEGMIVRVLEDQCGFSFRFEKLPDRARRAIQNYIEESN
ncbi:MAG: DUF4339 domain-containing protein [Bdellovibrio sp.]|nr:DUF4339 domain-containing protein [Bdellovibrio sp.]